jgi:hypothetical protein
VGHLIDHVEEPDGRVLDAAVRRTHDTSPDSRSASDPWQ